MSNPDTFENDLDALMAKAKRILIEKRALRGTANITQQGLLGIVTRIGEDKIARVRRSAEDMWMRKKLRERGVLPSVIEDILPTSTDFRAGDSLEDDLLDIANYALIAVTLLHGTWEK